MACVYGLRWQVLNHLYTEIESSNSDRSVEFLSVSYEVSDVKIKLSIKYCWNLHKGNKYFDMKLVSRPGQRDCYRYWSLAGKLRGSSSSSDKVRKFVLSAESSLVNGFNQLPIQLLKLCYCRK
jgi:hypothetical protein